MLNIYLTQKDIDQGVRFKALTCPVARAVTRRLPTYTKAMVSPHDISFTGTKHIDTIPMPAAVKKFVRDFDGGRPVFPMRFQLDVQL